MKPPLDVPLLPALLLSAGLFGFATAQQEVQQPHPKTVPQSLEEEEFAELLSSSPFERTLNLSGSYALTGIAQVGDETLATLIDLESKESHLLSSRPNAMGWTILKVSDSTSAGSVTATISLAGGSIVTVRFADSPQAAQTSRPPVRRQGTRQRERKIILPKSGLRSGA